MKHMCQLCTVSTLGSTIMWTDISVEQGLQNQMKPMAKQRHKHQLEGQIMKHTETNYTEKWGEKILVTYRMLSSNHFKT